MTGFPKQTISFLNDLRDNNDKGWFDANRDRYETAYLAPAKQFVEALAPNLDRIVPGVRAEPRVLGSIFRINRDTRFSKDKRPYKDHVDLWFWEGDRKAAISGLFFRVSPDGVFIGAGNHGFTREQLPRYRDHVDDKLAAVVDGLEADGYQVGGETYARVPRATKPATTQQRGCSSTAGCSPSPSFRSARPPSRPSRTRRSATGSASSPFTAGSTPTSEASRATAEEGDQLRRPRGA